MTYLILTIVFIIIALFFLYSMLTSNSGSVVIENNEDSFYEEEEKQDQEIKTVKKTSTSYHKEVNDTATIKKEVFVPKKDLNLDTKEEIKTLVSQGQKIKAIKLYREYYNVGLKEAKDAVENISVIKSEVEINPSSDSQVQYLVSQGQKIQAIKLYKELHNVDLKTAYEEVNKMS